MRIPCSLEVNITFKVPRIVVKGGKVYCAGDYIFEKYDHGRTGNHIVLKCSECGHHIRIKYEPVVK